MRFGFEEGSYSVAEDGGSAQLVIVKDGSIGRDVQLNFATSDGTASSIGKYLSQCTQII